MNDDRFHRIMAGIIVAVIVVFVLTGCSTASMPDAPDGAAAWCGSVDYTGTFTKSETQARALGVTNAALIESLTAEQIIELANALGCSR